MKDQEKGNTWKEKKGGSLYEKNPKNFLDPTQTPKIASSPEIKKTYGTPT